MAVLLLTLFLKLFTVEGPYGPNMRSAYSSERSTSKILSPGYSRRKGAYVALRFPTDVHACTRPLCPPPLESSDAACPPVLLVISLGV